MTTHKTATFKYIGIYLVGKIKLFLRISVKKYRCRFRNENFRKSKRESLAIHYNFNLKNEKVPLVLLRWIFRKWDMGVWTGSSWLRIGTGGVHL
jgi:hypothetical protein